MNCGSGASGKCTSRPFLFKIPLLRKFASRNGTVVNFLSMSLMQVRVCSLLTFGLFGEVVPVSNPIWRHPAEFLPSHAQELVYPTREPCCQQHQVGSKPSRAAVASSQDRRDGSQGRVASLAYLHAMHYFETYYRPTIRVTWIPSKQLTRRWTARIEKNHTITNFDIHPKEKTFMTPLRFLSTKNLRSSSGRGLDRWGRLVPISIAHKQ